MPSTEGQPAAGVGRSLTSSQRIRVIMSFSSVSKAGCSKPPGSPFATSSYALRTEKQSTRDAGSASGRRGRRVRLERRAVHAGLRLWHRRREHASGRRVHPRMPAAA